MAATRKAAPRTVGGLHNFPEFYLIASGLSAEDTQAASGGVLQIDVGEGRYNIINIGDGLGLKANDDDGYFVGEVTDKIDAVWEQTEEGPVMTESAKVEVQVL